MNEARQDAILKTEARMQAKDVAQTPPAAEVVPPADTPPPEADDKNTPAVPANAAPVDDDDHDSEEDDEDSADSNGDEAAAPKRKQSRREQRRFNKMTREKYEALRERDAAILRAQMLEQYYQQQVPQTPPAQAPAVQGKPTLESCGYDQDLFVESMADWKAEQKVQGIRKELTEQQAQRQMQEQGTRFNQRVAELEKKMPGAWQRATTAPLQTTPIMEQVIFGSDVGPEIGVYLADHLDEAQAISRLPPMQQAVALGRIEAAVKAAPAAPPRPPVAVSRAPAPSASLPSGASSVTKTPDKFSMEDHMAAVRAQRKAKFG